MEKAGRDFAIDFATEMLKDYFDEVKEISEIVKKYNELREKLMKSKRSLKITIDECPDINPKQKEEAEKLIEEIESFEAAQI